MAEIKPLRAWRYNPDLVKNIDNLVSPLFDVVSNSQRGALYEEPYNSIHLSVPRGEESIKSAARRLIQWKQEGIIVQDELPAIYVYYQYFTLPGSDRERIRKGFIANLRVYDWPEKVLLRHENTMPFSVNDRMDILDQTQLNVSPTHGLYTDPTHEIEKYMDEAMMDPLYETEDYQGVRDVFSVIHDVKVIKRIMEIIEEKQIILADGHHRYEGSLLYQKERAKNNPDHTGNEGYNYHLMYFTNTESDDLRILPTHRIVKNLPDFSKEDLLRRLDEYFFIKPIEEATDVNEVILGKKWAFGLLIDDEAYKIRLKPEMIDAISWDFPRTIKELDLTVMHYFVFEKCLGIKGKDQRGSKNLTFERNFAKCLKSVIKKEAQCAIITKDISIETVKEVCYSGYTLPQKAPISTPKSFAAFFLAPLKKTNSIHFLMKHFNNLILASKSPRRKELLEKAGFKFNIKTVKFDELFPEDMDATRVAEYLAIEKNKAHREALGAGTIITADTVVIFSDNILGKPKDEAEAKSVLKLLSGKIHQVMSGVCISNEKKHVSFSDLTEVKFHELTDDEIDHYVKTASPMDKAGSYGIQEWVGLIGVEWIKGSYFNVVGLPVDQVYRVLKEEF